MSRKYFGTDGIRGRVGEHPITADFVLKLGWALGRVLGRRTPHPKVLIGKDTRISGYMFESALEAGLSAAGADIGLLGPMPTPAIAYLTRTFKAQAGVVISASHNPFDDNGIKFFSGAGQKLDDALELEIEAELDVEMDTVAPDQLGKAFRIADAPGRYIEFCKSTIPSHVDLSTWKIVVDCAHGATYQIAPAVLEELGARVIPLGNQPNGLNINDRCGSTNPEALRSRVQEVGADIGIALDGDGDRVVMVDADGTLVDGDELLYIIALDQHRSGRLHGGVVGTKMTNLGLEIALSELDIPFVRSEVGDRHVNAELLRLGWQLGGESSGHILCLGATTTGDGVVSALQVLAALAATGRPSLRDMLGAMNKYPQVTINVALGAQVDRTAICALDRVCSATRDAERRLGSKGRVLLRPSGTEPVLRVMVEGEDVDLVAAVAQSLADSVRAAVV
ncbi:MAG: phosphoglucosamine mutase [Pseudomonadota bacterium]|nr:phosphoglucosamine mutase [Pseudomonadota bacterium]